MERITSVVELSAKKFVKSQFSSRNIIICIGWLHHFFQACDGAETCIVSCHGDQKAWNGSENSPFAYEEGENRTLKLSKITGLSLTDQNIEENNDPHCKNAR